MIQNRTNFIKVVCFGAIVMFAQACSQSKLEPQSESTASLNDSSEPNNGDQPAIAPQSEQPRSQELPTPDSNSSPDKSKYNEQSQPSYTYHRLNLVSTVSAFYRVRANGDHYIAGYVGVAYAKGTANKTIHCALTAVQSCLDALKASMEKYCQQIIEENGLGSQGIAKYFNNRQAVEDYYSSQGIVDLNFVYLQATNNFFIKMTSPAQTVDSEIAYLACIPSSTPSSTSSLSQSHE